MHIHTLRVDTPRSTRVFCEGCTVPLRLATQAEAVFVTDTECYLPDGPMVGPHNIIVVPVDFDLWRFNAVPS